MISPNLKVKGLNFKISMVFFIACTTACQSNTLAIIARDQVKMMQYKGLWLQ